MARILSMGPATGPGLQHYDVGDVLTLVEPDAREEFKIVAVNLCKIKTSEFDSHHEPLHNEAVIYELHSTFDPERFFSLMQTKDGAILWEHGRHDPEETRKYRLAGGLSGSWNIVRNFREADESATADQRVNQYVVGYRNCWDGWREYIASVFNDAGDLVTQFCGDAVRVKQAEIRFIRPAYSDWVKDLLRRCGAPSYMTVPSSPR